MLSGFRPINALIGKWLSVSACGCMTNCTLAFNPDNQGESDPIIELRDSVNYDPNDVLLI
jgi:hypothetical protein